MIIDIIFIAAMVLAIVQGYRRGFIVAVFSAAAIFIGLAAALKLSAIAAGYVGKAIKVSDRLLPFIAFVFVLLIVLLLVRWAAILLQKSIEIAMLGWINRLGGILLYMFVYTLILSVLIFYAEKIRWLQTETIQSSEFYPYLKPWGPQLMGALGKIIPFFKDMFLQLEDFFESVSQRLPPAG